MIYDDFDSFLAQPLRRWRISLFELAARILLVTFVALVLADAFFVIGTLGNDNVFGGFSNWSQYVFYLTANWTSPFNAIIFAAIPFVLKICEFRRLGAPGSPATVRDVVSMRWVQTVAVLIVVGSFASAIGSFDRGGPIGNVLYSAIQFVASSVIGLFVILLSFRVSPRVELDERLS